MPKAKKLMLAYEIKRLNERLDSQSLRIKSLRNKIGLIISNHKYYVNKRLPSVLKRERAKMKFSRALERMTQLLNKQKLPLAAKQRESQRDKPRYIGFFTHVEMQRLRRFLAGDHSRDYMLYRSGRYDSLKNKHLVFLKTNELRKLRKTLKIGEISA